MSIFKKEIEKDITDMVTGKKLIRRDYRRPGQSEYFYLSKNADGSHNQIDVPDDFGRQWAGKTLPDNLGNGYQPAGTNVGNMSNNTSDYKAEAYKLGTLSGKEESNNNYCAIGYDRSGGRSYGKFQIATKPGTMNEYIQYLNKNEPYKSYGNQLSAVKNNPKAFDNTWKSLCKDNDFNQSQEDYIFESHYNRVKGALNRIPGLNVEQRSPVFKDVVFSAAVQHRDYTPNLFRNAFKGEDISTLSDREVIEKLYNERSKVDLYFKRSSKTERMGAFNRMGREKRRALELLDEYENINK